MPFRLRGRKKIDFPYKVENNVYFLYPFPVYLFRRMDYDFLDKFIDDCGDEFGHGAGRPGGSGPSGIRDLPCGRTDHAGEQRVLPLRRQPAGVDPLDPPATPQVMEITVSATGRGHAEKSVITANIVDLDQNPPPDPQADDRNDGFTPGPMLVKEQRTSSDWSVWRPWWQEHWVWHSKGEDDGYWCDHALVGV